MTEKLSERVKQHFGTLRFREVFAEMAERIEALEALVEAVEPEDTRLAEAKAEIERLRPLAENWRLVLGMRRHTRLTKGDLFYKAERKQAGQWIKVRPVDCHMLLVMAAEALRAIQEVGDD